MKECIKCGTINSDSVNSCSSCMSVFPRQRIVSTQSKKICPECGEANDNNRFTCFNCMANLKMTQEKAQRLAQTKAFDEKRRQNILLIRKVMAIFGLMLIILILVSMVIALVAGTYTGQNKAILLGFCLILMVLAELFFIIPGPMYNFVNRRKGLIRIIAGQPEPYDPEIHGGRLNLYMAIYMIIALLLYFIGLSI